MDVKSFATNQWGYYLGLYKDQDIESNRKLIKQLVLRSFRKFISRQINVVVTHFTILKIEEPLLDCDSCLNSTYSYVYGWKCNVTTINKGESNA
jgi:hypothetical protein